MSLPSGTKLGPYVVTGPLGAGGMGEVYRARDERLGRDVAVKVVAAAGRTDPERLRRFEQEARATGQLNHPNILAVFDIGTHDGSPYVVEELLNGETLRDRMNGGAIPPRKAAEYAIQIAHGLSAAHSHGIVHRDLKPENVFITKDGRVKILDFGLAKLTASEPGAPAAATDAQTGTSPGVVMGTAGYMSPEQVRAQAVDHRSDIFSFGTVLYEMLAGQRPFQANSSVETMNAILREDPPEIASIKLDVPPSLERIVRHCLEKSPDERYQSARDLAFQLEALSGTSASAAISRPELAAKTPARRFGLVPVLIAGAAAAAAAFFAGRALRPEASNPTYSQLTFRQGSLFSGRFTPDGETIAYAAAWEGNPRELFSARAGSPESRSLGLPPCEILSISKSGEMALLLDPHFTAGWQRRGTLARAPIAGGAPRAIRERVGDADWDPAGKDLAVIRDDAGRYRLEYPLGNQLYETVAWMSTPRFSRDGQKIAFIDHPVSGDDRGRILVVDLKGRVEPLTDNFSSAAGLAWSPDGSEIWFTAGKTGNVRALYGVTLSGTVRLIDGAPADLVLLDVTPSGKVLLARHSGRRGILGRSATDGKERDLSWLDWSRPSGLTKNGDLMLFDEQGQGGGSAYSVYVRPLDGSPAVHIGSGSASSLSPDGEWATAISLDQRDTIQVLPIGPREGRVLKFPGLDITWIRWTRDQAGFWMLAREKDKPRQIWFTDLDGGARRSIPVEGVIRNATLSPDGKRLGVLLADAPPRIVPVDGGPSEAIPTATAEDVGLRFNDDGTAIYALRTEGPQATMDRIDLRTGERTRVHDISPSDKAGLIDLGYFLHTGDAKAYVYSYRKILSTLYLVEGLK